MPSSCPQQAVTSMLTSASRWCWTLLRGGSVGGKGSCAGGWCACHTGMVHCRPPTSSSGCWMMNTSPPPFSEWKEMITDADSPPPPPPPPTAVLVCSPQLALHRCEPAERLTPTFRCSHFSEERSDNLLIKHPNKRIHNAAQNIQTGLSPTRQFVVITPDTNTKTDNCWQLYNIFSILCGANGKRKDWYLH